jgi:hypothetical protein
MDHDGCIADLERRVATLETEMPGTLEASGEPRSDPLSVFEAVAQHLEPPGGVLLAGSVELSNRRRARRQETRTTTWLLGPCLAGPS